MPSTDEILQEQFGGPLEEGQSRVVTGAAFVSVVPADPDRIVLMLSNDGASAVVFSLTNESPPATGISVAVGQKPIELSLGFHGSLCRRQWFAASPAAASAATATFSKRVR